MREILLIKEKMKSFYAKYEMILTPLIKFLLSFVILSLLNKRLGYMEFLKNPVITVLISLICALLPYGLICWFMAGCVLAHIYSISLEMSVILAIFLLVVALLYFGFQPGDSYLLLLTPLCFALKIPYVIPLLVGLGGKIISIICVSCGTALYYIISYAAANAGNLTNDAAVDITQRFITIINGMFVNKTMFLYIIAFCATIIVVSLIRRLSFSYSWYVALAAGIVVMLVILFLGDTMYNCGIDFSTLFGGVIISAVIGVIYVFFRFSVDYQRTKYVQFEDNDYYYYVKAVPKMSVTTPDVKITRFNSLKKNVNNIEKNELR